MTMTGDLGALCEVLGVSFPAHPDTGELFVSGEIKRHTNTQVIDSLPPAKPDRTVAKFDENGEVAEWCELSDTEYNNTLAAWRAALQEWKKTRGRYVIQGVTEISGQFWSKSGAWAEGFYYNGKWGWARWGSARYPYR